MGYIRNPQPWLRQQLGSMKPAFMSKHPHFNFISVHYIYIISMTILGSVILFGSGSGDLTYIDALFFATGSNTQAGLNTVDVNNLNTFQQGVLMTLSMLSNPITMNSFVVWLRLYWFNKRFQNVVREARLRRGTISRAKSQARSETDAELGVGDRNILVMHAGQRSLVTNDGIMPADSVAKGPQNDVFLSGAIKLADSEDDGGRGSLSGEQPPSGQGPEIRFADQVKGGSVVTGGAVMGQERLPQARTDAEHIAILERQRRDDHEVLRIPGPRDVERGVLPIRVEETDSEDPDADPASPKAVGTTLEPVTGQQRTIVIQEPDKREARRRDESYEDELQDNVRAFANAFSFLRLRFGKKDKGRPSEGQTNPMNKAKKRQTFETFRTAFSRDKDMGTPYLSWEPTLGRNSAFPDLTEEQREELGGIEYRSLKTLAFILFMYFIGFYALGVVGLLPWILHSSYGQLVDAVQQNKVWWGFFTPTSAFMDLGFTLTPDSMNSFNTAVWPLLLMSFLIVIGNTGFPVMLRFIIWVCSKLVRRGTGLYEELLFLLDHPRRCFTLLFPSAATWWLFWLLIILNGVDLLFFIVLDLGSGPIEELPAGIKVLDGLFQAASTRTAGFTCVNLALLHPAVQVSYLIMMYISVFPIAISVRRTNVYEEKSLGVWSDHGDMEEDHSDLSYVGAHLRRQLSFDLWYIFVGFFILAISEGPRIGSGDISMFAVLFEIVSAYGTVGMSLGYSTVNASLSSQFSVVGKLVIVSMMIRGRHRGLPYGLDRAILLPLDHQRMLREEQQAAAQAQAQLVRRNSGLSTATGNKAPSLHRAKHFSLERRNSNFFAGLLQPGPPLQRTNPLARVDPHLLFGDFGESVGGATGSSSHLPRPVTRRSMTVAVIPEPRHGRLSSSGP